MCWMKRKGVDEWEVKRGREEDVRKVGMGRGGTDGRRRGEEREKEGEGRRGMNEMGRKKREEGWEQERERERDVE
jgi:hypothetical protein